jgi:hypothetical protein
VALEESRPGGIERAAGRDVVAQRQLDPEAIRVTIEWMWASKSGSGSAV